MRDFAEKQKGGGVGLVFFLGSVKIFFGFTAFIKEKNKILDKGGGQISL